MSRGKKLADKGPMELKVQNVCSIYVSLYLSIYLSLQLIEKIDSLDSLYASVERSIEKDESRVSALQAQYRALELSINALHEYCNSELTRQFKNEAEINVCLSIYLSVYPSMTKAFLFLQYLQNPIKFYLPLIHIGTIFVYLHIDLGLRCPRVTKN